jgi:hypothetical protein
MRELQLIAFCVMLAALPARAEPLAVEQEGPLSPCAEGPDVADDASAPAADASAHAWGVEIATAFSKEEALDDFARVQQDHADLLGSYEPMLVEACNLHMGTKLQYSARIGTENREAADKLCAKLQASGGACIVQKN